MGEDPEGVPPLVEGEPVGEHAGQVETARRREVEIVGDGVLADAVDLLDPEGVGPGDGQLFEVDGRPLPAPGRGHPRLDERPMLGQNAHAHLERLGLGDGVVDDVDPTGMGDGKAVERGVQDATGPAGQFLDDGQSRFVGHHEGGAEAQRQLLLGGEAGHHRHLDVGVQAPQCGHARGPESAGAVDEGPTPGRRRVAQDGVQGDGERIGQDGELVGDAVRHRDQHRVVGGEPLGPGPDLPRREAPTQTQVAGGTGGADRADTAWRTGEPRVEDNPVADLHPLRPGAELDHLGHHLVAGDVGERREGRHRVVDVAVAEVAHDELGVGSADAREDGLRHHPVGPDQTGVVHRVQPEGQREEEPLQVVDRLRTCLVGSRGGAEDERLHRVFSPAFAWAAACWDRWNATMPDMNLSMSATLASTTAFMSGRKCSKCSSSMASAIPAAVSSAGTRSPW